MMPVVRPRKRRPDPSSGVAAGEVVVDGHHMHALAGERIEIDRERCDQCLAFAGLHLGDHAFVQHHAANQLNVEMA